MEKGAEEEDDDFNVCASAVLAAKNRKKDECFVLLSLKTTHDE